ncbi:acetyl-CoA carboxylase [Lactiplantibacillus plantarum]|nr:acetyl-CoA carboxylase [Lactiplantibacillus plantarum]
MNSDIAIIKGRLTRLFKRCPQTSYWLMLSYDTFACYNKRESIKGKQNDREK